MINYREILVAYMGHIMACESEDYVDHPQPSCRSPLKESHKVVLRSLSEEAETVMNEATR